MYKKLSDLEVKYIHQGPARFALDLSDGSERGEYVDQDYILNKLGRPHRAINLMYCYYPLDKTWPARAHDAYKDQVIEFQWDYPYDDYFTYRGGLEGSRDRSGEPFEQMREVRRHGQDVILTMTMDPNISDAQLEAIGEDLRPFGRMQLRINHEATGSWFSFNKRASYEEVAAFFIHAKEVIKSKAPQIQVILCIGGIEDEVDDDRNPVIKDENSPMMMEDIFKEAVKDTDIWSVDKYMSLHWGWPVDIADSTTNQYQRTNVKRVYKLAKMSFDRFKMLSGGETKPMVMSEFNSDGDVTGPYDQAKMIQEFFELREADEEDWLTAITFYQFRDRGRLGLEMEDPNNKNVGIATPSMALYKKLLNSELCLPKYEYIEDEALIENGIDVGNQINSDAYLMRWGGSEDAVGLDVNVKLDKAPTFLELYFDEDAVEENLMIKANEKWFYKAPGVDFVDLMPLFFENPDSELDMHLTFFAPPKTGENDAEDEKTLSNYYTELLSLPKLRIDYGPVLEAPEGDAAGRNWVD